jgi:hypothetical protein
MEELRESDELCIDSRVVSLDIYAAQRSDCAEPGQPLSRLVLEDIIRWLAPRVGFNQQGEAVQLVATVGTCRLG